jgi:hypothetical protein
LNVPDPGVVGIEDVEGPAVGGADAGVGWMGVKELKANDSLAPGLERPPVLITLPVDEYPDAPELDLLCFLSDPPLLLGTRTMVMRLDEAAVSSIGVMWSAHGSEADIEPRRPESRRWR